MLLKRRKIKNRKWNQNEYRASRRKAILECLLRKVSEDMSILCLDVGDKTIGIAVSDSLRIVASGIGQLRRGEPGGNKELGHIKKLILQHEVDELVVGLPLNMKGEEGEQAKRVRNFVHELSSGIEIPVVVFDERLSTVEAERVLREAKVSPRKRRKVRDKIAATVILQNYLDSQRP